VARRLVARAGLVAYAGAYRRENNHCPLVLLDHDVVHVLVATQPEPPLQAAALSLHPADAASSLEPPRHVTEHVDRDGMAEPARHDPANASLAVSRDAHPEPRRLDLEHDDAMSEKRGPVRSADP
jgi:hypothetical protein